jgi:hypothetical protein
MLFFYFLLSSQAKKESLDPSIFDTLTVGTGHAPSGLPASTR